MAFHDEDLVAAGEDLADRGPAVAEVEAAVEARGLEAEAGDAVAGAAIEKFVDQGEGDAAAAVCRGNEQAAEPVFAVGIVVHFP